MSRPTDTLSVIGRYKHPANEFSCQFRGEGVAAGERWRIGFAGFVTNLSELGCRPDSSSGAQLRALLELVDRHGPKLLRQLKGNFVVLAESRPDGRLYAVRDRLGGRTIYYTRTREGWFFATRASVVLTQSRRPARKDRLAITAHFAGLAPPCGHTAFEGVHELRPGEMLEIDAIGSRSEWLDWPRSCLDDYSDTDHAVEVFRGLLDRAVGARLPEQAPVACMLSGGMDSGPLAESAARQLREQGRSFFPISWSLPEYPEADESAWIRELSDHLRQQAHLFRPSGLVLDELDQGLVNPDWPAFNPYRKMIETCYRMASEAGCRVILNGNAGDDLYVPPELLYRGLVQQREYRAVCRDLRYILHRAGPAGVLAHPPVRHELGRLIPRGGRRPPRWLTPSARVDWHQLREAAERYEWHPLPGLAAQMLGPRMTRGRAHEQYFALRNGVERRDPYHDEDLVGFMLYAPASFSIRNGQTKWIMREAMKGRLPEGFRLKGRTGLMNSCFSAGLRANRQSVEDLLFREKPEWQEWLDENAVRAAVRGDRRADTLVIRCIGFALWLRHWHS